MKKTTIKLLLCLSTALVYTTTKAQSPIITSTNQIHAIGDSIVYVEANSFGFDPITSGGPNVIWNYPSLVSTGGTVYKYEDPSLTTGSSQFPSANEAMANSNAAGHEWFESNSNVIKRLGFSDPTNGDIIYQGGGFVRYQFPFEAGDNWFTTSYGASTTIAFGLGEDSTVIQNGMYNADVDAYGTLTLPSGTINNVVRVHVLETFDLNVYMLGVPIVTQGVTDDYYFWFADNIKDPILVYGTTTGGSTSKVLRYQPVGIVTGVEESAFENKFDIYPNPGNGVFKINTSAIDNGNYVVKVLNVLGETVYENSMEISNHKMNSQIDISDLNKGIYFINISNSESQITKRVIIK